MNNLRNLKDSETAFWKFGLVSRQVERRGKYYYIHDFSDGWSTAKVGHKKLTALLDGKVSLLELNWK
jgi:predicted transcriptional regulator